MAEDIKAEAGKVGHFLTQDFHGLPVWAWGAVGIAGIVGGLWLRNRNQNSPAGTIPGLAAADSTGSNPPASSGSGGTGSTSTTTTTTSNSPSGTGSSGGGSGGGSTLPTQFLTTVGLGKVASGVKQATASLSNATGGKLGTAPRSIHASLTAVASGARTIAPALPGGPPGGYEILPDGSWLVSPAGYTPAGWACYQGEFGWQCYKG